ncbi:MAG: molybdenum cofactor biosynthesis protein B [Pirellulales bacterium]
MSVEEHKAKARATLEIAIITISDTRTFETDRGGSLIEKLTLANGHRIADRRIIRDDVELIRATVEELLPTEVDAILLTGGTGLGPRDVTFEALAPLLEQTIPGFGELFRMLSYAEIGAASMLSRAFAGVCKHTLLFALPGSPAAVQLAMEKLVLPELPHLVSHVRPSKNA